MEHTIETREKRPGPLKALLFLIILGLAGAGLVYAALMLRSEEGPRVAVVAPEPISAMVAPVRVQTEFDLSETYTGMISARRTSQLGFSTGGRVAALRADVGDHIAQGATLAVLDTRTLQAQLAAAEAAILEVEAARNLALTTANRQRVLQAQGHVSSQIVDEADARVTSADARWAASRAQADALRVQIDLARIRAPFAGVIMARMVDEGAIAGPGQPIFELVEAGQLEARIGVPESTLASLTIGDTYLLRVNGRDIDAVLRAVTGVVDMRERTVACVFDIAPGQNASAGSVARLPLNRDVHERGVWVPVSALTEAARGLWSVLVVEDNQSGEGWIAAARMVEIVHTDGPRAFVRGAIQDGELYIVDGLQRLAPGQPITPVERSLADSTGTAPASPGQ